MQVRIINFEYLSKGYKKMKCYKIILDK